MNHKLGEVCDHGSHDTPPRRPIMSEAARVRRRLIRWLGPWSSPQRQPRDVSWDRTPLPASMGRTMEVVIATPTARPVVGGVLLAPGLHFGGAQEARMARFIAVLASSGLAVCAPDLPDYIDQIIRPSAVEDLGLALDHFLSSGTLPPDLKPAIFTISFGSWPGLSLASRPGSAERVGGVVTFGGFADWRETLRFCVGLDDPRSSSRVRDPLNRPVCFMNLYEELPGAPQGEAERAQLFERWRAFMEATWGRDEMKVQGRHIKVAQRLSRELPEPLQRLFLQGCAAAPGGEELCERALERSDPRPWLDPRRGLAGLRAPLSMVHGRDDDVIPFEELARLAASVPGTVETHTYVTGLYGHSEPGGLRAMLRLLPRALAEGRTMMAMLADLVRYAGVK